MLQVNEKIKGALLERKTLKYEGPRMRPLPPPQPRPEGGRPRKEKVITKPGDPKLQPYNWKTFSMGIGLGGN